MKNIKGEQKKYKGVKTLSIDNGQKMIYYEQAYDARGNGLENGDRVKVIMADNTQMDLKGNEMYICEIFEGDLRLCFTKDLTGQSYYCWPNKVIKI